MLVIRELLQMVFSNIQGILTFVEKNFLSELNNIYLGRKLKFVNWIVAFSILS